MNTRRAVRSIALLEAAKGLLVLLAGFGLLEFLHRDVQHLAEDLVAHFHLNPASRFPRLFIDLSAHINDTTLWLMTGGALLYASLRLFEAFGLWHQRRWAEWLGAVSGAIYIPIEIYELLHGFSALKLTFILVNMVCVIYLAYALYQHNKV